MRPGARDGSGVPTIARNGPAVARLCDTLYNTRVSLANASSVLVYRYGLASPHVEGERVLDQMRCAHRYRNELVEIERGRRQAERAIHATASAAVAHLVAMAEQADKDVAALVTEIRRERSKTRSRSDTSEQREKLRNAKAIKSERTLTLRQARKDLREAPDQVAARDILSERARGLQRGARQLSGLAKSGPHFGAWGTYQLAEEAAQASFAKTPLYAPDGFTPNDPGFVRWHGEGAVSVQIQGGASVEDITSGRHPQIHVSLPDERAWLKMPGNGWSARRRYARHGELSLCLGTDADGTRIYGRWRMDMHRPLPVGARIKRATVHRRVSGPHAYWSLELTLDCPLSAVVEPVAGGAVAVDLGWRAMDDGSLRVAGWADTHGHYGDVCLEPKLLRALREPDEIRSARDARFDMQILRLARWLDAFRSVPEWLRTSTTSVRQWKSPARLHALRNRWQTARFEGDEIAFHDLDAWVTADTHYWEQECRRRDGALRHRREVYRVFAAKLATTYSAIVLEQFDLRTFAVRQGADADKAENETARSNRHLAAVSELRLAVLNAARSRRRTAVSMPAHDTTRTCPSCGLVEDRNAAMAIMLSCECGATWDQDSQGAAPVLLARWRERPGDAKVLVGARIGQEANDFEEKAESRRERIKRLRTAKLARMGAAREDTSSSAE